MLEEEYLHASVIGRKTEASRTPQILNFTYVHENDQKSSLIILLFAGGLVQFALLTRTSSVKLNLFSGYK